MSCLWFVRARTQPVADYAQLIEGYAQLAQRAQGYARQAVDELFTEAEAGMLQNYLKQQHQTGVSLEPVALPMKDGAPGIPYGARPLAFRPISLSSSAR